LNNHYLRQKSGDDLAQRIASRVKEEGFSVQNGPALADVCELLKDRANTLNDLAEEVSMFYIEPPLASDALAEKMQPGVADAIRGFLAGLPSEWTPAALSAQMKAALAASGLKMPQLAMPLRLMLMGRTDTPSIDKVMSVLGRDCVVRRIQERLGG